MNDSKILSLARETIDKEIQALESVKSAFEANFTTCVKLISNLRGRVIISGIGKSAIIAQKIVATFNSIGTPSLFMHAADALHGDLGMVQKDDIIILISKSGETSEMVDLANVLNRFDNEKIAIVKNAQSTMAKLCDYCLLTPIEREADPNNLAPTASTIAQMAVGDAIASCLVVLNNFTPRDFAVYHPGGNLGQQLNLKISDLLIQPYDPPAVSEEAKIMNVLQEISAGRKGAVAVVSNDKSILGLITDGDIRRWIEKSGYSEEAMASSMMTKDPIWVSAESNALDALTLMEERDISQVIVKENDTFIGIIHMHDLLDRGLKN